MTAPRPVCRAHKTAAQDAVREIVGGYRQAGVKRVHAIEQAAVDLGISARRVRCWLEDVLLLRCLPAERALIEAGHAAWREREAQRLEARAQQLRRRSGDAASVVSLDPYRRRA